MAVDINVHYTDRTSDPSKQPFTLVPGEVNQTETSLVLSGQGAPNYSTSVNENFLRLLENFASATPPLHGTVGQVWYNTGGPDRELRILSAIGTGAQGQRLDTWSPVANNIVIGASAPSSTNKLWYDTSNAMPSNHQLKIYNTVAGQWQPVAKQWFVVSNVTPSNTSILWYNTAAPVHELYVFDPTTGFWDTAVSHNAALLTGSVPDAVLAGSNIGGNAATATLAAVATNAVKLQTGRVLALNNGAAGSVVFDGSSNVTLNVTSLNANVLSGTVPVTTLGASGNRVAGYYLAGNNVWTQLPAQVDAYTKTESNTLINARALSDGITYVGFASDNPTTPYMRRTTDNGVYYLQPRLGYTPAPAATTLAGYNISDAYTKAQVNALIPTIPPITGSLALNGWTRIGNGMTLQWGQGPALNDDQAAFVNLLVPGTILNINVTGIGDATGGIGPCFLTNNWSTTNFKVSNNLNSGPSRPFSWLAVTIT